MSHTNQTKCKQTGLACTAGRPQELTASAGFIASPTMYNVGKYPPNADCVWKITVPRNQVSTFTARIEINYFHFIVSITVYWQ